MKSASNPRSNPRNNPRTPQHLRRVMGITDLKGSDDIRRRYHAWVGNERSARKCLEAACGYTLKHTPHWLGDGNVPADWRVRMERQMKEQPAATLALKGQR